MRHIIIDLDVNTDTGNPYWYIRVFTRPIEMPNKKTHPVFNPADDDDLKAYTTLKELLKNVPEAVDQGLNIIVEDGKGGLRPVNT
jgi:hypothetical protein